MTGVAILVLAGVVGFMIARSMERAMVVPFVTAGSALSCTVVIAVLIGSAEASGPRLDYFRFMMAAVAALVMAWALFLAWRLLAAHRKGRK